MAYMILLLFICLTMASDLQILLKITGENDEIEKIHKEKGFAEAVSFAWESVISADPILRERAEHAVAAHEQESDYYQVLISKFNMKEHFSQVWSHRKFVKKAFDRLEKHLHHVKAEDAEKHDLSKYTLDQAVGYTARWVHGKNNSCWMKALEHHYRNEPHHPQYYDKGVRMEPRYLEESLIDMVASRWERKLKGNETATDFALVNFDEEDLLRYQSEDLEVVKKLIETIKQG